MCIINFEILPADHLTKKFILNPVEGWRSAPTRSSKQHKSVMGWQWGNIPWKRSPYIEVSNVLCYKPIPIIIRTCLDGTQGKVRIWNCLSSSFPFENGLKQRDALLLLLFNFALEYAIRKLQETN